MNKKVKILIGVAALALLLVASTIFYNILTKGSPLAGSSSAASNQSAKKAAPNFTVYDTDGKAVSLTDFKGKPVVINFWASWCPPCKAEMPDYEKMYKQYSLKGVIFLMIDMTDGSRETVPIAKKYLADNNFTFTAYFDTKNSAASVYQISSIPGSIFIDKSGNVENSYIGLVTAATMQKNIEAILNS